MEAFASQAVALGSVVYMVGWSRVARLPSFGYEYEIVVTDGDGRLVSRHFPGSSAWCPCSSAGCSVHNGAVKPSCPDRYLDEFTFRFNRWTSRRCGNLFWHPLEYALSVDPAKLLRLQAVVHAKLRTQHNGRNASCRAGFVEVAQETFTGLGACCKSVNCRVKGHSAHLYGPKTSYCALCRPYFCHFEGFRLPIRWILRAIELLQQTPRHRSTVRFL